MATKSKTVSLATLKIDLMDASPPIWRRVRVPLDISLDNLNFVIQVAMGWTNSHLHSFTFAGGEYGMDDGEADIKDENGVALKKVLGDAKGFFYMYDYGDSWEHRVEVESIEKKSVEWDFPVCLAGERACPPEDVGGIPGYEEFCKTIADPKSADHEETLIWAGGAFDPDSFDINRVNRELRGLCWPAEQF